MTCLCHSPGLRRRALLACAVSLAITPACAQPAPASAGRPDPKLLDDLVAANHILADQNVLDAFGHVSARHDRDPGRYLLSRSLAPALVKADDIMEFDLDSVPVDPRGRTPFLERFIHGAIYRARPEVMSIVHSHSPTVVPFADVAAVPLRPMYHMAAFLGGGVPVFEIRDVAGPGSTMLISNAALGHALAAVLGPHDVALMRGHGYVAASRSVRLAVFRAVYTEVDARMEGDGLRLGRPTYLNDAEAKAASRTNDAEVDRAWDLWAYQASRRS